MTRPLVLIVGAGGVFGSRLARLLAGRKRFGLILAGRSAASVEALARHLAKIDPEGGQVSVQLDRDTVTPEQLRAMGRPIIVDCAGPFQLSGSNLVTAAIAARCPYVDLADSRHSVANIGQYDAAAKASGMMVITGASSTPALSNAVIASLTAGWRSLDTIDCAIVPGNRTPKGRSVVEGILSWVGQPVAVYCEAAWQSRRGWSGSRRILIEGLKPRRVRLADVPDLDAFPAMWTPRVRAAFSAGMELPLLNGLIALAGLAVRWRLIGSARLFAGLGTLIANALDRVGSTDGGMLVEVSGQDADGDSIVARWQLTAHAGDGPYVPVGPAAALVERLAFGEPVAAGACSAAGLLGLDEIRAWYDGLAIHTWSSAWAPEAPLYRRLLGSNFDIMPETTRRLHRGVPAIVADGEALVTAAATPLGRLLAGWLGMPTRSGSVPIRVVIEQRDGREYWCRSFAGRMMRSEMREVRGLIAETFGPFTIRMRLIAHAGGLDMQRVDGGFLGIPIPQFLLPRITAEERVDDEDRHVFKVHIGLPLLGRLAAYRGNLKL